MTLAQLYYIIAVDNFRHFSTAANHCFVTQPTLSMQIQKLEEELGVLIFDRTKQPVVPTDVGAKIIRQARRIIAESERLQSLVEDETGEYTGTLKLGVIPTAAPYLIPLFVKSFVDKYPKVELTIDELTTGEIISGLHRGSVDAGILALHINDPDIVEKTLFFEPFVGYVSKQHPFYEKEKLSTDDLTRHDLLLLKEGHCLRDQALQLCRTAERVWEDDSVKILFESGNLDTLKKLVVQGFGFTLLPYLAVKDITNPEEMKLVREFADPVPKREIGLVFGKSLMKKNLLRALEKEIKDSIPQELLEDKNSLIIR